MSVSWDTRCSRATLLRDVEHLRNRPDSYQQILVGNTLALAYSSTIPKLGAVDDRRKLGERPLVGGPSGLDPT